MFLIWKHLLWETLFSSYQKVAFEKKKLKSFDEEAHRILCVGGLSLMPSFFFLLDGSLFLFLPSVMIFSITFLPTTVFSLPSIPYLTEATYNLCFPTKYHDTFTFPKESKQTAIPKSCFTVENGIPKSYWMSSLLWYCVLVTHGHQYIGNVKPYF